MIEFVLVLTLGAALGYTFGCLLTVEQITARLRALRDRIADDMPIEDGTVVESRTVALGVMGEVLSELER